MRGVWFGIDFAIVPRRRRWQRIAGEPSTETDAGEGRPTATLPASAAFSP
jgi:hypothetical protein